MKAKSAVRPKRAEFTNEELAFLAKGELSCEDARERAAAGRKPATRNRKSEVK